MSISWNRARALYLGAGQVKTQLFGVAEISEGYLTLGSVTAGEGKALRFRAAGVEPDVSGRVKFHANLQDLDEIGVVACMLSCEPTELPKIVWVSARMEDGRITGLGRTTLAGSEVMGILGGVFQDVVLFLDPIVATDKAPLKKGRKGRRSRQRASESADQGKASGGIASGSAVEGANGQNEKLSATEQQIPPLHHRVAVLSPQSVDAFPCTSSHIAILDNPSQDKTDNAGGPKKKKGARDAERSTGDQNGGNGLNPGEAHSGSGPVQAPDGFDVDPNLLLKGENGREIADDELLF
jgi:hypothetical protein